jgi:cephalosporin hydroxylase
MVSFEVQDQLRHVMSITRAIEALGPAARLLNTVWYVRSELPAPDAAQQVWQAMEPTDVLLIVDVAHNVTAMFNVDDRAAQFVARHWHRACEAVQFQASAASSSA